MFKIGIKKTVSFAIMFLLFFLSINSNAQILEKSDIPRIPATKLLINGSLDHSFLSAASPIWEPNRKLLERHIKTVDRVVAVPVKHGQFSINDLGKYPAALISSTGSFSLEVDKDKDWLLVLVNTSEQGKNRFVDQVAFPLTNTRATLLLLPATAIKVNKIDLGIITHKGNFAITQKPLVIKDFSLSAKAMAALAHNDDNFATVKNLIINYDAGNGIFYKLRPDFKFFGNYADMNPGFTFPYFYGYRSYNFQLDSNSQEVVMDNICGTNGAAKMSLELFPPAGTTVTSINQTLTYNDSNPIANENATLSTTPDNFLEARDEDFFATNRYGNISYSLGGELITNPIPPGYWQYKVAGFIRAQFDESIAAPVTTGNQVSNIAPGIHANVDATGRILSFDIKWFVRDEITEGKYKEVPNITGYLIDSAGIFLENNSTGERRYESIQFNASTQSNIVPAQTWYYGNSGNVPEQAEMIGAFYSSADIGYFFQFPRFVYPQGSTDNISILPIPGYEQMNVHKGQAYHHEPDHSGLDFGFNDWPNTPGQYALHDIISPWDGIVTEINEHVLTGSGNVAFSINIRYNQNLTALLAFEPDSQDSIIVDRQRTEIAVSIGQIVKQGDLIGRLVVPLPSSSQVFGPHVHWSVIQLDAQGKSQVRLCPRTYCTPQAQTQVDEMYERLWTEQGLPSHDAPCTVLP